MWHADGDLGRKLECVSDMTDSCVRGFCAFQPTPASFFNFERLRSERLVPEPALLRNKHYVFQITASTNGGVESKEGEN